MRFLPVTLLTFIACSLPLYAQKLAKPVEPVSDPVSCSMLTDGMPCVIRRQMEHHREGVGSFDAAFQQETTDSQLKVSDIEKGRIKYLKEEGLPYWKMRFTGAKKRTLAVEGGTRYHSYDSASGNRITGAVKSDGPLNLFSVLGGNVQPSLIEQIKPADLTYEEIAPDMRAWHIRTELVEKDRRLTDFWVEDGMVVKATLETGTTKNTYLLTDIRKNVPVKKDEFRIEKSIIEHVLDKMNARRKELKTIVADVKTTVSGAKGEAEQVFEGKYQAIFPMQERNFQVVQWKDSIYGLQRGKYLVYRPAENTMQRGEAVTHPLSLALVIAVAERKEEFLTFHYLGQETISSGSPTWRLKVEPRQGKSIGPVEIWVDKSGMVVQVKVEEATGITRTVLFSNIQKNVKVNAEEFRIKMPKDVKLVN